LIWFLLNERAPRVCPESREENEFHPEIINSKNQVIGLFYEQKLTVIVQDCFLLDCDGVLAARFFLLDRDFPHLTRHPHFSGTVIDFE
jgi:hypothetical protein